MRTPANGNAVVLVFLPLMLVPVLDTMLLFELLVLLVLLRVSRACAVGERGW